MSEPTPKECLEILRQWAESLCCYPEKWKSPGEVQRLLEDLRERAAKMVESNVGRCCGCGADKYEPEQIRTLPLMEEK